MIRALLLVALLVGAVEAIAAQRMALVIGNGAYQHTTGLPNPANDARLLADTLRKLGFVVELHQDLSRAAMGQAVLGFGRRSSGAELALVFYAGHGVQMNGVNWLLPVDARLEDELALREEAISMDLLLEAVSQAQVRVLVLDACRNNPFLSRMKLSLPNRSVTRGLAPVNARDGGTLIAFSTSPDDVAEDGPGRNSPFSTALARHMVEPGLEIRQVLTRVRQDLKATGQTPWENSSLTQDVFLASRSVLSQPSPLLPAGEGELRIEVIPANAVVRVDGVLLGTGSRSVKETAGKTVVVRAEAAGHEALEERVRVQGGQVADVVLRLTPLVASPSDPALARPEPSPVSTVPLPLMVEVPAGTFQMGSPSYEEGRESDEGPVRAVRVKGFRLGKYEVTRGEFGLFVEATGYRTEAERDVDVADSAGDWAKGPNPGCFGREKFGRLRWLSWTNWRVSGFEQEDDHPVVCVSWNDAKAYIEWLNGETGRRFRLPSEAEQEYAIRAGSRTPYAWGTDVNGACAHANVTDQTGAPDGAAWPEAVSCNDGSTGTSAVGRYRANGFGLYDTVGNAMEWGQDCYGSYAAASEDGRAMEEREERECERRVARGGSWNNYPSRLRSAFRGRDHPASRFEFVGFRLAEDL